MADEAGGTATQDATELDPALLAAAQGIVNGQANGTGDAASVGGDAAEGGQAEEKFTDVDPEKLAPELKAVYKGMQAAFTRKTQEIASQRKFLEEQRKVYEESSRQREEQAASLAELRAQLDALRQPAPVAAPRDDELEPWQVELRKEREHRVNLEKQLNDLAFAQRTEKAEAVFEDMKTDPKVGALFKSYEGEMLSAIRTDKSLQADVLRDPEGAFERLLGRFTRRDYDKHLATAAESERKRILEEAAKVTQKAASARTTLGGGATQATTKANGHVSFEDAVKKATEELAARGKK